MGVRDENGVISEVKFFEREDLLKEYKSRHHSPAIYLLRENGGLFRYPKIATNLRTATAFLKRAIPWMMEQAEGCAGEVLVFRRSGNWLSGWKFADFSLEGLDWDEEAWAAAQEEWDAWVKWVKKDSYKYSV